MFPKLSTMMLAVPLTVVAILPAGAEESRKSTPAQSGIQLSEWGRETRLPELTASAWSETRDESELPDFGEFLSEEVRTLGAGALDSEQLRDMMANRLVGREDDSALRWLSSRWETAPGRLANFFADSAELRLESSSWVESADLEWNPTEDNWTAFSASGVGVLHRWENAALGILPNIERTPEGDRTQGSFGVFHRRAFGQWGVAGVNLFADYADDRDSGEFSRWSLGADFRSAWADVFVNRYFGKDSARQLIAASGRQAHYAPDGLDAEFRLHAPQQKWLDGFARFSEWEGRFGQRDDSEFTYGMAFTPIYGPLAGLRAEMSTGDETKFLIQYGRVIGAENSLARAAPFAPERALLAPAVRENDILIRSANLLDAEPPALAPPSEARQFITDENVPSYLRDAYDQCRWTGDISDWISNTPSADLQAITDYQWAVSVTTAAASDDDFDDLCQALRFQGNPNHRDSGGNTPLHFAAKAGALQNVKLLILAGADPTLINNSQKNALEIASDALEPLLASGEGAAYCETAALSDTKGKLCEIGRILRAQGVECRPGTSAGNALCNVNTNGYRSINHRNFAEPGRHVLAGGLLTVTMHSELQSYSAEDNYLNSDSPFYSGINRPAIALINLADAEQLAAENGKDLTLQFGSAANPYSGGVRIKYLGFDNPPYVRIHEDGFVTPYTYKEQEDNHGGRSPIAEMSVITLTGTIQYTSIASNPQTVNQLATILVTVKNPEIVPPNSLGRAHSTQKGLFFQADARMSAGDVRFEIVQTGSNLALEASGKEVIVNIQDYLPLGENYYATLRAHFSRDGTALSTDEFAFTITVLRTPLPTLSAEDGDWRAPQVNYAAPGYSGVLFSITATTPVTDFHYSVSASGWRAAVSAVRGNVGVVRAFKIPAGTHTGTVSVSLNHGSVHMTILSAAFTVTVLPQMSPVSHTVGLSGSGSLTMLAADSRLTGPVFAPDITTTVSYRTLTVNSIGQVDLRFTLELNGASYLPIKLTASNLLGTMRVTFHVSNSCIATARTTSTTSQRTLDSNLKRYVQYSSFSATDVCRLLLQGADPNTDYGYPLRTAAKANDVEMVALLLDFGADVNRKQRTVNKTPMHFAAQGGAYEAAVLMYNKATPLFNQVDSNGNNELHFIGSSIESRNSSFTRADLAQFLINRGVSVNAQNQGNQETPLHLATRRDQQGVMRVLLQGGASPNAVAPGYLCRTPLHYARSRQRAQILVEAGANINPRLVANNSSDNGKTPMDTIGNSEARAYLQSRGGCYGGSHSSTRTPRCSGNGGSYQCPNSGATAQ